MDCDLSVDLISQKTEFYLLYTKITLLLPIFVFSNLLSLSRQSQAL